jgi:hypothetical protein
MARHFSLLRSSRGKLKNETKPVPLSGRKVTLGRRGNIGKEPGTAIPPCPDQPSNTNFHHFLPVANRADTGDRGKAFRCSTIELFPNGSRVSRRLCLVAPKRVRCRREPRKRTVRACRTGVRFCADLRAVRMEKHSAGAATNKAAFWKKPHTAKPPGSETTALP